MYWIPSADVTMCHLLPYIYPTGSTTLYPSISQPQTEKCIACLRESTATTGVLRRASSCCRRTSPPIFRRAMVAKRSTRRCRRLPRLKLLQTREAAEFTCRLNLLPRWKNCRWLLIVLLLKDKAKKASAQIQLRRDVTEISSLYFDCTCVLKLFPISGIQLCCVWCL